MALGNVTMTPNLQDPALHRRRNDICDRINPEATGSDSREAAGQTVIEPREAERNVLSGQDIEHNSPSGSSTNQNHNSGTAPPSLPNEILHIVFDILNRTKSGRTGLLACLRVSKSWQEMGINTLYKHIILRPCSLETPSIDLDSRLFKFAGLVRSITVDKYEHWVASGLDLRFETFVRYVAGFGRLTSFSCNSDYDTSTIALESMPLSLRALEFNGIPREFCQDCICTLISRLIPQLVSVRIANLSICKKFDLVKPCDSLRNFVLELFEHKEEDNKIDVDALQISANLRSMYLRGNFPKIENMQVICMHIVEDRMVQFDNTKFSAIVVRDIRHHRTIAIPHINLPEAFTGNPDSYYETMSPPAWLRLPVEQELTSLEEHAGGPYILDSVDVYTSDVCKTVESLEHRPWTSKSWLNHRLPPSGRVRTTNSGHTQQPSKEDVTKSRPPVRICESFTFDNVNMLELYTRLAAWEVRAQKALISPRAYWGFPNITFLQRDRCNGEFNGTWAEPTEQEAEQYYIGSNGILNSYLSRA